MDIKSQLDEIKRSEKPEGYSDCTTIIKYISERRSLPRNHKTLEMLCIVNDISTRGRGSKVLHMEVMDLNKQNNPFEMITAGEYWFHKERQMPFFVFCSKMNIPIGNVSYISINDVLEIKGPMSYYPAVSKVIRRTHKKLDKITNTMVQINTQVKMQEGKIYEFTK